MVLMCVMFTCVFVTFSCHILGQVWYTIVSIPVDGFDNRFRYVAFISQGMFTVLLTYSIVMLFYYSYIQIQNTGTLSTTTNKQTKGKCPYFTVNTRGYIVHKTK